MKMLRCLIILMATITPAVGDDYSADQLVRGATLAIQLERAPKSLTADQALEAFRAITYVEGYIAAIKVEKFIQGPNANLPSIPREGAGTVKDFMHKILAVAHSLQAKGDKLDTTARVLVAGTLEKEHPRPNPRPPTGPPKAVIIPEEGGGSR